MLGMLGILAINALGASSDPGRGPNPVLGDLLALGAVVDEALFTIFAKVTSTRITPLATSTEASVFALLTVAPLTAYEASSFDFSPVSLVDWTPIAHYGVFVTVVAFFLWFRRCRRFRRARWRTSPAFCPSAPRCCRASSLGGPVRLTHLVGIFFISRAPVPT
jgi:drug/metabolite transporter (DMT)-like permease